MKKLLLFSLLASSFSAQAASIVLVTDNAIQDATLITFLEGLGHSVSVTAQRYRTLDDTKLAELNSADLVVVSRWTDSSLYSTNDVEVTQWATISTPLLLNSVYLAQSARWGWSNGGITGTYNLDIAAANASVVDHPLFTGVSGTSGGAHATGSLKYPTTTSGSINLLSSADGEMLPTANVIARRNSIENPWVASLELFAGSEDAHGNELGSHRLLFATIEGNFEASMSSASQAMYANAVSYLLQIPEPSSILLGGLGLLALARRRRN